MKCWACVNWSVSETTTSWTKLKLQTVVGESEYIWNKFFQQSVSRDLNWCERETQNESEQRNASNKTNLSLSFFSACHTQTYLELGWLFPSYHPAVSQNPGPSTKHRELSIIIKDKYMKSNKLKLGWPCPNYHLADSQNPGPAIKHKVSEH